jgi:hypothetical protein
MAHKPYQYKHLNPKRYIFISEGKKRITKVVEFIPLGIGNLTNLGFGDLLPDDSIDDKANSNNGDLVKVLATVIDILRHFTMQHPDAEIYFEGSTEERTVLYSRILKNYYSVYSKEFAIAGVISDTKDAVNIIPYEPSSDRKFLAFLIKRIS